MHNNNLLIRFSCLPCSVPCFRKGMGKNNYRRGRKRKIAYNSSTMIQASPTAKRKISLNPSRRKSMVEPRDEQPDLQQWLRQSSPILEVKSPHTPTNENRIVVQAEVHHERATPNQNTADNLNLDAIDIALDIAKDAALVKSNIKRIEEIILNTKDTQTKEHNTLLFLLNSIQENVEKIDEKSDTLEDKIHNLSNKLNIQEQGLHEAKQDIKTLFKSMSCLEKHHNKINPVPQSITETNKEMCIQDSNSIVISNLPNHKRDAEDVMVMFHIGLCVPMKGVRLKNIRRAESLSDRPVNITVELENVHQKIYVLHNKRNLGSKRHSLQAVELSQRTQTAVQIVSNLPAPSNGGPIYRFWACRPCGPAAWLVLLLTKAGDVETNPGLTTPNKKVWICDICHKQIQVRKQISIRCNRIEHWVHL